MALAYHFRGPRVAPPVTVCACFFGSRADRVLSLVAPMLFIFGYFFWVCVLLGLQVGCKGYIVALEACVIQLIRDSFLNPKMGILLWLGVY